MEKVIDISELMRDTVFAKTTYKKFVEAFDWNMYRNMAEHNIIHIKGVDERVLTLQEDDEKNYYIFISVDHITITDQSEYLNVIHEFIKDAVTCFLTNHIQNAVYLLSQTNQN